MKSKLRGMAAALCALALLFPGAGAAGGSGTVRGALWRNDIWMDGTRAGFFNEWGRPVTPVSYGGTVYIPLRTAGEWMGCTVAWDQRSQSVTLTGGGQPVVRSRDEAPELTPGELEELARRLEQGVEAVLSPGISVLVDGVEQRFTNAGGEPVYPLEVQGVTYLPVRNVAGLCGREAAWVPGELDAIYLHRPLTQGERRALEDFLNACARLYGAARTLVDGLPGQEEGEALAGLRALQGLMDDIQGLALPETPYARDRCQAVIGSAGELRETYLDGLVQRLERGETTLAAERAAAGFGGMDAFTWMTGEKLGNVRGCIQNLRDAVEVLAQ